MHSSVDLWLDFIEVTHALLFWEQLLQPHV